MSTDWGLAGGGAQPGQHHSDLAADEAALGGARSAPASACCPRRAGCTDPDARHRRGRRSTRRLDERARGHPLVRHEPVRRRRRGAASRRWSSTSRRASGSRRCEAAGATRERRADLPPSATRRSATSHRRAVGLPAAPPRLEAVPRARGGCARPVRRRRAARSTRTSTAAATPTARGTTWAACSCASRPAR